MKRINSLLALLLAALWLAFPIAANAAGAKNSASQRGGKAAEHMSDKGSFNSNAQWSADPDRGWVRADERHEKKDSASERDRREEKTKGRGKAKGF